MRANFAKILNNLILLEVKIFRENFIKPYHLS